ncbi:helix-turn-helix transcriptional regulator [Streptomyces sp. NBC_01803]|uniref:helix-turn-helix transcriptional regulator n=1 Tax=Streptomyces sp. NBC_01803 TaxID=2975946 RepID=UPI002DDB376D|nr:helix-turn-helix transcriptional regulator [Streptomyces sp. NBC_01803]WSA44314.1 helix-turn-helix domain-containing protein [Streptomyces sp. NBC_01803]
MTSVTGANIRRLREDRGWSQARLARETCRAAGIPDDAPSFGRQAISRYETGKRTPREWLPFIAQALDVTVNDLKAHQGSIPLPVPLPDQDDARGDDYAHAIRRMSRRLVVLDNEMNGLPIADMAARAFKAVHRRLGEGAYEPRYERDIRAAAAELAEVAGWALFDAEKHDTARRFNQEALLLARLSGDRAIELLILQNIGMQSGWLGRPREEIAIARSILEQGGLPPRVEAIFRTREARGLSASGQESESANAFDHARSLLGDGEKIGDPFWAWWITAEEIDGHQACEFEKVGDWAKAIPLLQQNLSCQERQQVGYRGIYSARLLASFLGVRAWREAEELAESIIPTVSEIASIRTLNVLAEAARKGEAAIDAPPNLRAALHGVGEAINEDPYTL